jgi:hypothetical protein
MPPKRKNTAPDTTAAQPGDPAAAQPPTTGKARVRWTSADDALIVATLTAAKANGLQADSGWKPVVWQRCADALKDSLGPPKTSKKCQDHWGRSVSLLLISVTETDRRQLKKDFKDVQGLRDLSGFGWDDGLKMVTATDPVWDDLLKVSKSGFQRRAVFDNCIATSRTRALEDIIVSALR